MRKFLKVAAIFILVATAFTVTYYVTNTREQPDFPDEGFSAAGIKEARLILSGGEEIILKEKHSAIEFDSVSSQIHIQRDSSFSYSSSTEKNAMTQVVVPFGKRSDIVLSDGTRVCLNAGSVLLFPQKFQGKERLVFLKGEAYFKVEKNHGKPFIVSADKLYVTVLGTEFNLKANESDVDMEIVLVKGAVSLRENKMLSFLDREISLKPNQRAIYHKSENKTTIESGVNTGYFTSWTEGFLEFNTESILNVFNRLSMYYNVRFVTDSSVELNRKISGKLDLKESLEEVLKVVADAAPVSFRVSEDQIYVSSRVDYIPKY
jgi:ferric-dicitrate binding protein FerR (iron transport regulator)